MKAYNYFILIGILLIACSCNLTIKKADNLNHNNDIAKVVEHTTVNEKFTTSKIDNDIASPIDSLKINRITMRHDTMSIFGWASYLIFPLDTFKTPDAILKAYPFFNLNVKQSPVGQISPNLIDIYTYTYQKSFIQFTESEPDYYLDVMSGDIIDERIVLKNSIHVGLIKEDVFKILGIQCDHLSDINTIEFICTLDGYWQYYTFANDTLRRILIESR